MLRVYAYIYHAYACYCSSISRRVQERIFMKKVLVICPFVRMFCIEFPECADTFLFISPYCPLY